MALLPIGSLAATLSFSAYCLAVVVHLLTASPTPHSLAVAVDHALSRLYGATIQYGGSATAAADPLARGAPFGHSPLGHASAWVEELVEDRGTPIPSPPGPTALADATAVLEPLLAPFDGEALRGALLAFVLFAFFWGVNTIHFAAYSAMAGATTHWYFFRNTPHERPCCGLPALGALYRTLRYHLGSVAFGALLVAIVQAIRVAFEFVIARARGLSDASSVGKLAVECTRCCLWCLEQCLRLISSLALIFVALDGGSFLGGCKDTLALLCDHPAQAALMRVVQALLYLVQSAMLPVLCALAAYRLVALQLLPSWIDTARAHARASTTASTAWLGRLEATDSPVRGALSWLLGEVDRLLPDILNVEGASIRGEGAPTDSSPSGAPAPLWPAVATLLLAFVVARSFASLYECAIDATFVSALRDAGEYGGAYMSDSLREALGLAAPNGHQGHSKPSPAAAHPGDGSQADGKGGGRRAAADEII